MIKRTKRKELNKVKVYVFGNENVASDRGALNLAKELGDTARKAGIEFSFVEPNGDLPFGDSKNIVIMDVVEGLPEVKLFKGDDLARIVLPPRITAHDFDLGFQLKYLTKLGKLGRVTLIGLPAHVKVDYKRIHAIFKKLVAQDMQGS